MRPSGQLPSALMPGTGRGRDSSGHDVDRNRNGSHAFIVGVLSVDPSGTRDHRCRWPRSALLNRAIDIREQFAGLAPKCARDSKQVACYIG